MNSNKKKNINIVINLLAIIAGMLMLAWGSVPLYRIFCQTTGFGGTVKQVYTRSETQGTRNIKIFFDSNIDPSLNWHFINKEHSRVAKTGENVLTFYIAENLSNAPTKAMAAYNVTPLKAGKYFHKVECFCFIEQILLPKQKIEYPVLFYIDPKIEHDRNMDDIEEITLSYTFFNIEEK